MKNDQKPSSTASASTESKSVLIVDDSPVMRDFMIKVFSENNFKVVGAAADGVEAVEMFERYNPDIMTLDIIMPKMRGTEVLARIVSNYPEATVVMASSVSDARTVMRCLKIGAKQYVIKPYDKEKVMAAVAKALEL